MIHHTIEMSHAWKILARDLLFALFLFGLLPVGTVVLRRILKTFLFALQDERRLRWARAMDQALRGGTSESLPSLRFRWDKAAAEEALLERFDTATPSEQAVLQSLFRSWGLLDRGRTELLRRKPWAQAHSVLLLGEIRCTESLTEVRRLLHRAHPESQIAVLNALELLGDPAAIPDLVEFLARQGTCRTRPVLSTLLACSRDSPWRLVPFLSHTLPLVRMVVATALAEVATPHELDALIQTASEPEPEVRAKVARALGRTGDDQRALEALHRLAADAVWYVRLQAVAALSHLRLPGVYDRLLQATRDKHWRVRETAAMALHKLVDDPVYLLGQLMEGDYDRYALDALITALEREGVTWKAVNNVCSMNATERENSHALILKLLRAKKFTTVLYAIEAHPDPAVGQELLQLLKVSGDPQVLAGFRERIKSSTIAIKTRRSIEDVLGREGINA